MAEMAAYIAVDTIPELAEERARVRDEAWSLIKHREAIAVSGHEEQLPLALDALSTAQYVLTSRDMYGDRSLEHLDRLEGLRMDCRRLVAEWYRKKRPEYFPPSRHYYDEVTEDYFSHGLSLRQMTENALRPIARSAEETDRRVNERVEDETPRIIRKAGGIALHGVGIRTISECTDQALSEYEADQKNGNPHRGYDGYVPEIKKLMIRDMRLHPETGDRLQEQLGLPGIFIDEWVLREALERRTIAAKELSKTALHGMQLLVEDDLMDFVRQLDDIASENWRTNVFMGEEVPAGYEKNYETFRQEALDRQESLKDTADTVATFILDLAEDNFDKNKAPAHVEEFVKKLLLEMAKQDGAVAEQMFDKKTAAGLQEVRRLQVNNRHDEAFLLMQQVERQAPGGGFCSGGSCGLESVNMQSDEGRELFSKLKAKPGDLLVKDKERSCACSAKGSVVYAYNSNKVNKYCTSCEAFESKVTSGKSNDSAN